MGAGPASLHPRVASALTRPMISHLDKGFIKIFEETQELLRSVMCTENPMTFAFQGPGSAAMELCIVNLVEPGDKVIVMSNGVYGERMRDMATIHGARVIFVDHPWGEELSADKLEEALCQNSDVKMVCCVHGESATGVLSDVQGLAKIAAKHGALVLCDIAATLAGLPVYVDEWGLDAVYSNPQKCLSSPPGLAPISLSPRAIHKIKNRKTPVNSWYFNLLPIMEFMKTQPKTRVFPHTSPSHCYFALHEALLMIHEEGLHNVWCRHKINAYALTEGLKALGCQFTTSDAVSRIPLLNVIQTPLNVAAQILKQFLINHFYLDISDGMGKWSGKTIRIGAMGQASVASNIIYCISSLGQTLQHFGYEVNIEHAIDVTRRYLLNGSEQQPLHVLNPYTASCAG